MECRDGKIDVKVTKRTKKVNRNRKAINKTAPRKNEIEEMLH